MEFLPCRSKTKKQKRRRSTSSSMTSSSRSESLDSSSSSSSASPKRRTKRKQRKTKHCIAKENKFRKEKAKRPRYLSDSSSTDSDDDKPLQKRTSNSNSDDNMPLSQLFKKMRETSAKILEDKSTTNGSNPSCSRWPDSSEHRSNDYQSSSPSSITRIDSYPASYTPNSDYKYKIDSYNLPQESSNRREPVSTQQFSPYDYYVNGGPGYYSYSRQSYTPPLSNNDMFYMPRAGPSTSGSQRLLSVIVKGEQKPCPVHTQYSNSDSD